MSDLKLSLRAKILLAMIRDPQSEVYEYYLDGPWMCLSCVPNMGPKTCAELVEVGILKERPLGTWSSNERRWYRLATPVAEPLPEHEDFGDLWVAG